MTQLPTYMQVFLLLLFGGAFAGGYYAGVSQDEIWLSGAIPALSVAFGSLLLLRPIRRAFLEGLSMGGSNYLDDVRDANKFRGSAALALPLLAALMSAVAFARESHVFMAIAGTLLGTSVLALTMNSAFKLQA